VIQERTFERVGSNRSIPADVRLVAATHRNLDTNIQDGRFREDLYYRLNVFPIDLPPLRERRDDIPLLINEFIIRLEKMGRGAVRLTPGAMGSLCDYPWPGNVRELANLMERMVIMFPNGLVDVRDLPPKFQMEGARAIEVVLPEPVAMPAAPAAAASAAPARLPADGIDLKEYLAELELSFINQALDEADGVVARAAERLGMRRTTLVEKMKKYGMQRGE
jgi:sigma-54 specific flagellar transcriptional regulator A